MTINLVIIQIALIFLPGIIWTGIDSKYASKKNQNDLRLTVKAFSFGIASYVALFVIYRSFGAEFDVLKNLAPDNGNIALKDVADEIVFATILSFLLAIIWVYAANYKLMVRFLQIIRATKKYGDEDVWDYTFNSESPISEYIHYRDFDKKIVYSGWVSVFSETNKLRELILKDAEVYDFDGNLLYNIPNVYLARSPNDMNLEFPYKPDE